MDEVRRYVNLAFIVAAMVMSWFYMKFCALVMSLVPIADERLMGEHVTYSTIAGIVLGIVTALLLWRNPKVHKGALDVAGEMREVTWPTADETKYSMKVVIAMSVIVAAILFCFDFVAKQLTELILGIN